MENTPNTLNMPQIEVCDQCGEAYSVGDFPFCKSRQNPGGHTPPSGMLGEFKPYFDIALGEQIDSLADRRRHMRLKGFDYRDDRKRAESLRRHAENVDRSKSTTRWV